MNNTHNIKIKYQYHTHTTTIRKSYQAARASLVVKRTKGPAMITVKTKESARAIESFIFLLFLPKRRAQEP